jgi:glycosyltransferase involved in cell wall biosynthesis
MLAEPSANTNNWCEALAAQSGVEVKVWSMTRLRSWLVWLTFPVSIFRVRAEIRKQKPDLLIAYRTTSYGFLAACSGFSPYVVAAQGETDVWPPGHWTNFLTSRMASTAIRGASLVHAWGLSMADTLRRLGATEEKVWVHHRGVLLKRFSYSEPFQEPFIISLVCTRSLFPEYHHNSLLRVLKVLEDRVGDIKLRLIMIGDGPLIGPLRALQDGLKAKSNVIWAGRLPSSEIGKWLEASDFYVSLSDTEGISSSLLEAMACGCYPIVTDLPGNREWIQDGVNGALVGLDEREIVSRLLNLIENRFSLLDAIRQNRRRVEDSADAELVNAAFVNRYRTLTK